jgi:hypothetical protein
MQASLSSPGVAFGQMKSFGAFGPKYRVGSALRPLEDGDWVVEG